MKMNWGGEIGSAICGIVALVAIIILTGGDADAISNKAILIVPAMLLGYIGGNFLSKAIFGEPKPAQKNRRSDRYDDDDEDDRPRHKRPSNRYDDEDDQDDRPRRARRDRDEER